MILLDFVQRSGITEQGKRQQKLTMRHTSDAPFIPVIYWGAATQGQGQRGRCAHEPN